MRADVIGEFIGRLGRTTPVVAFEEAYGRTVSAKDVADSELAQAALYLEKRKDPECTKGVGTDGVAVEVPPTPFQTAPAEAAAGAAARASAGAAARATSTAAQQQ